MSRDGEGGEVMILNRYFCWWQQLLLIIFFIIIAALCIWGFRKLREWIWRKSKYSDSKIATFLNRNWGIVILLGALSFFAYIILITIFIFGEDRFIEGVVVATPLTIFIIFQLPRLLKPHIHITFLPIDDEGERTSLSDLGKSLNQVTLYTNTVHKIHLHTNNLGVNIYENWSMFISFPQEINVSGLESSSIVEYTYQQRGNAVICHPRTRIPYGPDDAIIFKIRVKTPNKLDTYRMHIEFKCSTRWGETEKDMYLNVISNKDLKEQNA